MAKRCERPRYLRGRQDAAAIVPGKHAGHIGRAHHRRRRARLDEPPEFQFLRHEPGDEPVIALDRVAAQITEAKLCGDVPALEAGQHHVVRALEKDVGRDQIAVRRPPVLVAMRDELDLQALAPVGEQPIRVAEKYRVPRMHQGIRGRHDGVPGAPGPAPRNHRLQQVAKFLQLVGLVPAKRLHLVEVDGKRRGEWRRAQDRRRIAAGYSVPPALALRASDSHKAHRPRGRARAR
jgi:hypothetical protein